MELPHLLKMYIIARAYIEVYRTGYNNYGGVRCY